ncbi:MAG: OB-fold nucleic acid binding domain-containing protein, partial [Caldilineaceae bacterium]
QTAYLKAHYPVDYMAALLLIERDKTEKVVNFINECRRMGIEVLPPDVNYSGLDFEIQAVPAGTERLAHRDPSLAYDFPVPEGSAIRFGMAAVKNVGEGPVNVIIAAREEGGPFAGLEDFCDRVDLRQVNKRSLECLIKVGALDRFGKRSQLLAVLDQMMSHSAQTHNARESGQLSMFDLMGSAAEATALPINLPDIDEVKGKEKLQWEKELLGVYSISHPLMQLNVDVRSIATCACNELDERHHGQNVMLIGMIADVRTITTKKGDLMAFVNLEDMQGQCEMVVFPRTFEEHRDKLIKDNVVLVKGKAETRNGQTNLLADTIQTYVEQAQAINDAPPVFQTQMIDTGPTVNGINGFGDESEDDMDSGADDLDGFDGTEAGDFPAGEENPFRNDAPEWLEAVSSPAAPQPRPATWPGTVPPTSARRPDVDVDVDEDVSDAVDADARTTSRCLRQHARSCRGHAAPPKPAAASTPTTTPAPAPQANGTPAANSGTASTATAHTAPTVTAPPAVRATAAAMCAACASPSAAAATSTGTCSACADLRKRARSARRDRFVINIESKGKPLTLAFPEDPCTINDRLTGELVKHFRVDVAVDG